MAQVLANIEIESPNADGTSRSSVVPSVRFNEISHAPETETSDSAGVRNPANGRTVVMIATLTGVNFLSSLSTGLLTVGLPQMASDVGLPAHLLLW